MAQLAEKLVAVESKRYPFFASFDHPRVLLRELTGLDPLHFGQTSGRFHFREYPLSGYLLCISRLKRGHKC